MALALILARLNQGIYLGSIYMDTTPGQVSGHRTYGQARKWGIFNAYNRVPVFLQAGDQPLAGLQHEYDTCIQQQFKQFHRCFFWTSRRVCEYIVPAEIK